MAVKEDPGIGFFPNKHLLPICIPAANQCYKYTPISTTSTNAIYSMKVSALSFDDLRLQLEKGEALKNLSAFREHLNTFTLQTNQVTVSSVLTNTFQCSVS